MEIQILEFVSGAQEAEETTVIIDVFRAFSVACYATTRVLPALSQQVTLQKLSGFKTGVPQFSSGR